jgi:hypothetical protein
LPNIGLHPLAWVEASNINQYFIDMKSFSANYKLVDKLIFDYLERGGEAIQLDEGCLQSGDWILYDESEKLKCFYIFERYLNEWSADQVIRSYNGWNKFPKKYKKIIEEKLVAEEAE